MAMPFLCRPKEQAKGTVKLFQTLHGSAISAHLVHPLHETQEEGQLSFQPVPLLGVIYGIFHC